MSGEKKDEKSASSGSIDDDTTAKTTSKEVSDLEPAGMADEMVISKVAKDCQATFNPLLKAYNEATSNLETAEVEHDAAKKVFANAISEALEVKAAEGDASEAAKKAVDNVSEAEKKFHLKASALIIASATKDFIRKPWSKFLDTLPAAFKVAAGSTTNKVSSLTDSTIIWRIHWALQAGYNEAE